MVTTQQEFLTAYALWLQDRGLRHPVLRAVAPRAAEPAATADAPSPSPVKVVFVGDGLESGEARALLDKMVTAMKLTAADVAVVAVGTDLARFSPKAVVTMGGLATSGAWLQVKTHHPAELLKTPTLKRQAWSDLQVVMEHLA